MAEKEHFFRLPDGRSASLYHLRLPDGAGADITDFGGSLTALYMPDRDGKLRDVVLGWRDAEAYLDNPGYLGALIGRIPNRIGGGRFTLDGKIYQMCLNDRDHSTLHGGFGFSHRLWEVENFTGESLTLRLFSGDGDGGFPGNLTVRAIYTLHSDHTLELEFFAVCDRVSVADFTSHAYFNLAGENSGKCDGHLIRLNSAAVTEVDDFLVPTGRILDVAATAFDLRQETAFAEIFSRIPGGFDNNFILGEKDGVMRDDAAVVWSPESGIRMRIHTSRPGLQFYMGEYLPDTPYAGKSGIYPRYGGFCLETQNWPDAVNHPEFPSVRIEPGKPLHGVTRYHFDTI